MTPDEIKQVAEQAGLIARVKDYGAVHVYTVRAPHRPAIVIDDLCDYGHFAVYDPNPDLPGGFWRDHYTERLAWSYGTHDGRCFNRALREWRGVS
jgi:hypothetical protein